MTGRVLEFLGDHWRSGIEILILAVIFYQVYLYFRGTRGAKVLTGLLVCGIAAILISQLLRLVVITWIIKSLAAFLAIALVVIFQPELRRGLAALGSHRLLSSFTGNRETMEELAEAIFEMASRQMGALVAIERDMHVRQFAESGVTLDAEISRELIVTIFHPRTPLHDGGVILRNDRLHAAACIFPVTQREAVDRNLGLRHRAALGITEESDAVAIVVSEETGVVSICHRGKIERNFEPSEFRKRLGELLMARPSDDEIPHEQLDREAGVVGRRGDGVARHQEERRNDRPPV
jgi:diadenylate cyclase